MSCHSSNTASSIIVPMAAVIYSLFLTGVAGAQTNTSLGAGALQSNTTGSLNTASGFVALGSNSTGSVNTASGVDALFSNTTGNANTASGVSALRSNTTGFDNTGIGIQALFHNTTGVFNTAVGFGADVSAGNLQNATAIGSGAVANANNKIRLGNTSVTVIEGQVAFTASSDKTKKENFQPVDGEEVLEKIRGFELSSWNFIGHDPKELSPQWSHGAGLFCGLRPRRSRADRHRDDDQLGRPGRDFDDCGTGAGEAHGGAKREAGADCGTGIAS